MLGYDALLSRLYGGTDEHEVTLTELDEPDGSSVLSETPHLSTTTADDGQDDRGEPKIQVYADMLLLLDAFEREDPTALAEINVD